MNKYNNPRLLNTVVSGTGMKNPVRPHVIIGSEENGFIRGDLMDANAIQELIVTEIAAREHGDEELTEYIDEKVQLAVDDLVDGAPEVLDTLKELSEALGDDANFATTITEEIASKVDKVEGKGLSTNDYTNAEKQKLAGIAAGAEVNVQSDWNVTDSSNDAFIKNKPTKLSLFTNDVPYTTQDYIIHNFETKTRVTELKQSIKEKIDNIESVLLKVDNTNGHEYVDLGLPSGTLWATMNVGATTPEETGNYYMYGMDERRKISHTTRTYDSTDTPYDGTEIPLDLSKDTARQVWGGDWYTPTKELFDELVTNTTYSWVTDYNGSGLNGGLFTAENNNSIFIPAAGGADSSTLLRSMPNQHGRYWTSEPVINDHTDEVLSTDYWYFEVNPYGARSNSNWDGRTFAYFIRPVINSIEKRFKEVASKDDVDELKENLTFTETTDPANNGHEYVEIGGIKWATMNVGATSETDYGLYFQWGDTQGYTADQVGSGEGKKAFAWSDYKFNPSGDGRTFTKYNATDSKTTLDLEDDAVAANWGGEWRMPTTKELQALGEAVDAVWTEDYNGSGINGILCTDKTDSSKKLFFPAAGYARSGSVGGIGDDTRVWSRSLYIGGVDYAWVSLFYNGGADWHYNINRYFGHSVRGVLDGEPETTITPVKEVVTDLKSNEEVIAAALNNLNTKIEAINATLDSLIAGGGNAGGGTSM